MIQVTKVIRNCSKDQDLVSKRMSKGKGGRKEGKLERAWQGERKEEIRGKKSVF